MTDDFMNQLKTELDTVKTDITKHNHYPVRNSCLPDLDIWGKYYVVMQDGIMFIISCSTKKFPNVDFDKIKKIIKQDITYEDNHAYEMFEKFGYERFFDSDTGEYFAEELNMHGLEIKTEVYTYENE